MKREQNPFKKIYMAALLAMFSPLAMAGTAISTTQMPSGGQVVGLSNDTLVDGSVNPNLSSLPNYSNIELSNTNNSNAYAVIRWNNGFDIGSQATLSFGTSGTNNNGYILNIDGSGNASQINGTLDAATNTSVFLANGNGIIVGKNAVIKAPGGIALLGESMDNTTAVDDFVGTNGSQTPYLDFGSIYPGNVDVGTGSVIEGGSSGVLIAGASIVNSGTITSNNITILAGWVPQKGTATIDGVSSTPVYRLGDYLPDVLDSTPSGYIYNLSVIPGSSYTFTNAGTMNAAQNDHNNEITLLSQGGMALYGAVTASDENNTSYEGYNGVEIDNTNNNVTIYGNVTGIGSRDGNFLGNGIYNYEPSVWVNNSNGNIVFGQSGKVSGSVTYLSAPSIQGYYQADNVVANDLYLNVMNNINATGNPNSNNFLGNGFGVASYTAGASVYLTLTADAEGQTHGNVVNIAINGSGIVNSGDTRSVVANAIQSVDTSNSYGNDYLGVDSSGNYTAPPSGGTSNGSGSSTNDGGSMIIQASGQLSITPPTQGYLSNTNSSNSDYVSSGYDYGNGGAFVFGGGVVLIGNDGLTVNAPIINAWSNGPTPFQGVFLQGSQIDFNNNAYVVTGPNQFVNFSTTPGTMPVISQFVFGNTFESPSAFNPVLGSGAYLNSYSTVLQGVLAGQSLGSVVNTTPIS
ncbi:filamentous hemagglutinin N-terminal domain-containing protein [Acidithiobacillus thiooxidans]|uniref:filamentous hemagglutinin N-terminal domain-containing protein n=1 Tax=Acidithiobacillus thiooxidans TaxID=930 RepID=UPI001C07EA08|nr:filamentous hemagglutinin N-terminal domain-containing protein [Acidithiobacillus thiooxidans]MBU2810443.1 filamentous hemagglutinin N-terminal domain-containing protein [Acidithiobacillus thiooxidans]